jgi:exodeoxyribonuclease V beta subunit
MTTATPAASRFAPEEFQVCGRLPTGVTVLEASAGTGKTYTIAALAARYVAEGTPLERLLLVTFTRIATGELRERVRERLVTVERGLARALAGAPLGDDPVVELLAREDVERRRERLERAIASFDAATIATTHGFCQEVLSGLGIAGDLEPDVTFAEDLSDLVADIVDDLYVRRFSRGGPPAFGRAQAAEIARAAIESSTAYIVSGVGEVPAMRERLARAARDELARRKRDMAVMTYDDLVTRLRAALAGPNADATRAALRRRFDVVLVDEFQDTDPDQWEILRCGFVGDESAPCLVLIADPKQAIYAFRGADVYAYLEAAASAGTRATLQVNWRSDQRLIDAHDALLSGVKLGHEGIAYREVRAAPGHEGSRLSGIPQPAPMRIRIVRRDEPGVSLTRGGYVQAGSGRAHVARDLAADIVSLLQSGGEVRGETVAPGHLAVLVRTNRHAAVIREALDEAGVPAVINGAGSVFATEIGREWLRLLEALERPASITRAHSAALTCFIGWSAQRLAEAGDDDSWEWEQVHRRLHDWARVLRTRGVASLLETIMVVEGLPARMLADVDGERRLTDLRHVGQLLHGAATTEQLGATALTAWLRTRIAEAESDTGDEERSRRLESDAAAVQVLTIHRSKGLEFPIVYLPYLWEPGYISEEARPVFFHDPAAGDRRTLDVALEGEDYGAHRDQFYTEQRGEDLRLAYVALTRARHQVVMWWAGSWDSRNSPLGRLMFSRNDAGDVAPSGASTPDDAKVVARLSALADRARGSIAVERATLAGSGRWSPPAPQRAALSAVRFDRTLDLRWRRTSYTDITSQAHETWVGSEPEEPLLTDEPAVDEANPPTPPTGRAEAVPQLSLPSLLGGMPVGADVGTFVHRVMEATDFAASDLDAELAARIDEVRHRQAIDIGDPGAVVAGLRAAIETPLGPALDGLALRDVQRADRLDELGFELPLAGGDRPDGWLAMERVGAVLREQLAADDPLAGYAARLADPGLRSTVRGYLTGSLDLVVRLAGPDGGRFAVLDYKTNWLGEADAPLTSYDYRPEAIAAEMSRHHYALQALLYTVALHRYLRWRLPGYAPERHLAGVAYLFVRGMTGDAGLGGATPSGVFCWRPPAGFVEVLSDALHRGEPER